MRKRVSSKVNFGGHGDYLSEHDLELKYKDQPDVAKAIVKNGRKMFDPVKELWLYEDVSYKSKFEDEECIEEDRRTHLDFEARQAESSAPTPQSQPRGGGKRESVGDATAGPDPKKKKHRSPPQEDAEVPGDDRACQARVAELPHQGICRRDGQVCARLRCEPRRRFAGQG